MAHTYSLVVLLKVFGNPPKARVNMPYSATLTTHGGTVSYQ